MGLYELLYADDLVLTADSGGGGVNVWGVEAGSGEERVEGKLGKDKDNVDGGGRWRMFCRWEVSVWSVRSWCWS